MKHKTPHAAAQARYWARRNKGIPPRSYRRRPAGTVIHKRGPCALLVEERKSGPCVDCGGRWPSFAMDLDHTRGIKIENIARLVQFCNMALLIPELDKCDLVCASCHRVRTHARIAVERAALA